MQKWLTECILVSDNTNVGGETTQARDWSASQPKLLANHMDVVGTFKEETYYAY